MGSILQFFINLNKIQCRFVYILYNLHTLFLKLFSIFFHILAVGAQEGFRQNRTSISFVIYKKFNLECKKMKDSCSENNRKDY